MADDLFTDESSKREENESNTRQNNNKDDQQPKPSIEQCMSIQEQQLAMTAQQQMLSKQHTFHNHEQVNIHKNLIFGLKNKDYFLTQHYFSK